MSDFLRPMRRLAAATVLAAAALVQPAAAESPFHTGVWQTNGPNGPEGLILSDWLVFEDGLPARWLYRKAGTNDANQFDFYTRAMGESVYAPVEIRVYRTGEHEMTYTVFTREKNKKEQKEVMQVSAKRLSIPNYKNSCLSVENKGERLFGRWAGTRASSFKSFHLSKSKLTIDGKSRKVEAMPVRTGRIGIVENGQPIAFLTDGGGDYAVVQWFRPGVDVATMMDPKKEILDFAREEIIRWPNGTCDRQIKSRLATMK